MSPIELSWTAKKCLHSQESGQVLLTLGLGVALPSVVGYVGAVRESKVLLVLHLSCQPLFSISLVNLSQSFNLPLSTSHQVLLVLYLSPLLLAWGLQLLILLLLPALQSSIYKGLSSLASTSLSFYQVHGPETHPIGLNQTELVSIHQYWPQSTTNGLNQSDLVLIHQAWS